MTSPRQTEKHLRRRRSGADVKFARTILDSALIHKYGSRLSNVHQINPFSRINGRGSTRFLFNMAAFSPRPRAIVAN